MKTNDLKSGDRIRLRNGWFATIWDNKKGNIRLAKVEGVYTEIGSVYGHDIVAFIPKASGAPIAITHTDAQLKLRRTVEKLGF
jgi:hypothetical protein